MIAPPHLYPVRTFMACCHVLVNSGRAEIIDTGLQRAAELQPEFVVPNHYLPLGRFDAAKLAARFRGFADRKLRSADVAPPQT